MTVYRHNNTARARITGKASLINKALLIPLSIVLCCVQAAMLSAAPEVSIHDAIKKFAETNKRMRIAVFDFADTAGQKTRFDAYIADTIVSELSKYPLTLLERKKLETLLGEHALSQSGVVDSGKALKLGTLLPVDVVVSGSYTELGGRFVVNGRFIHVGTGEIIYAFTSSIEAASDSVQTKEVKSECERRQEAVKKALNNLRDQDAVNRAVDALVAVPFQGECAKIHFDAVYTFSRHKIFPERYKRFLLNTLRTIENPSDDRRAGEILHYFAADGKIDEDEWTAGIDCVKKMSSYALHNSLRSLLNNEHENTETIKRRTGELMRLTADGKIGRPVPVREETMFFAVLAGLSVHNRKADNAPAIAFFHSYRKLVPDDDTNNKKAAELVKTMYFADHEKGNRKGALSLLIDFFTDRNPSELLAESTADLVKSVEAKRDDKYEQDGTKAAQYQEDLGAINASLGKLYCTSVGAAKKKGYRYIVDERTIYMLKNKMSCEYAPSLKDLESDMRSGDWDKKLKAIELLSKIGMAAQEAEKTVIKYLGQQGYGSQGGRLRRLCALTLGNIRTTDPEGITMLIESFPDYDNGVSYEAEESLKKIGIDALPYLIQGTGHKEHAVRLRCAKALGNLGSKAKKSLPELERLAATDDNPYVRKEAQGAVQLIKNDF